jgi:flotillin
MEWEQILQSPVLPGIAGIVVFFLFISILKSFIKVTLPNKVLVVTGKRKVQNGRAFGFSIEKGRTSTIPYLQQVGTLDLGILPINVRIEGVNSANGITVGADATACVCIDNDTEAMLYTAVERLMGKTREQIREQIQQTLIGNFRGALNKATPLQAIGMEEIPDDDTDGTRKSQQSKDGERAQFRNELLKDINSDLTSFGMKVVSVSLQKIWDTSNYIGNLAQKTIAQKRQQVEIEESRLHAIAQQAESDTERRITVARNQADERIIEARQKLEVFRQESEAAIQKARLEADQMVQEAQNRGQIEVQKLSVELKKLHNMSNVILEADAKNKASTILSEGERDAVNIVEGARNEILSQKAQIFSETGDLGRMVIFVQQKLPLLFKAYKAYAEKMNINSMLVMDDREGLNGAANRGPSAFLDFLKYFEASLGVKVNEIIGGK